MAAAPTPVTLFRTLTTGVYVIGVAHGGRDRDGGSVGTTKLG